MDAIKSPPYFLFHFLEEDEMEALTAGSLFFRVDEPVMKRLLSMVSFRHAVPCGRSCPVPIGIRKHRLLNYRLAKKGSLVGIMIFLVIWVGLSGNRKEEARLRR